MQFNAHPLYLQTVKLLCAVVLGAMAVMPMAQAQDGIDTALQIDKLRQKIRLYEEARQQRMMQYLQVNPQAAEIGPNSHNDYWLYDYVAGQPVYFGFRNLISQQTVRANMVKPGGVRRFGLTGAGITVGVWDNPVRTSHVEFAGRITSGDGVAYIADRDHGTHVAGTIAAAGINADAQGFAHGANIRTYNTTNDLDEVTTAATAATNRIFVSNHSYGPDHGWVWNRSRSLWQWNAGASNTRDWLHGAYTAYTGTIDDMCFNLPNYLMVRAAGNEQGSGVASGNHLHSGSDDVFTDTHQIDGANGFQSIPEDISSKNTLAVGNVQDIPGGYTGPASVVLVGSSSTGPTDDGRIKPDLVANGAGLTSTLGTNDNAYGSMGGTSMAAPSVTGSIVLLQQFWFRYNATAMRGHTMKALLIHTADEAGPSPGPDYRFGWGLLNVDRAARLIHQQGGRGCSMINANILTESSIHDYSITTNGTTPIKATLAWHEPAATNINIGILNPGVSYLVNNLNLQIIGPGGVVYRPWVLNPTNPGNAATRGINNRDNVEQVLINNPPAGTYTVRVTAPASIVGFTQSYGLIITGQHATDNFTLNGVTMNAAYSARQTITITGNSTNGTASPARLQAGNFIDLKPGFSALGSRHPFDAISTSTTGCHVD
jgi:hypothetical protein